MKTEREIKLAEERMLLEMARGRLTEGQKISLASMIKMVRWILREDKEVDDLIESFPIPI